MECDCSALRAQPALTNMRVAEVLVGESRPPAARTRNVLFFARGLPSWQVSRLASQSSGKSAVLASQQRTGLQAGPTCRCRRSAPPHCRTRPSVHTRLQPCACSTRLTSAAAPIVLPAPWPSGAAGAVAVRKQMPAKAADKVNLAMLVSSRICPGISAITKPAAPSVGIS
jgi:hypothetical protein